MTAPAVTAHYISHDPTCPEDQAAAIEEMKQFAREDNLTPETARIYKLNGVIALEVKDA